MWYPSNDYFTSKGTLTGLYNYDACARQFGEMSLQRRIEAARKGAVKLHPEFANESIVPSDKAISIAWQNMKWERGGWAEWDQKDSKAYYRLLFPDGRFFVVGDQVSSLPGWQEGAMMSAERVVGQIGGVETAMMKAAPVRVVVPDTRRLVQGRH
jgi:monoamine oxidase